ncbi:hypothetical protein Clacol_004291 [Clathrus columnatus]|uniref:ABC transporter domain-containing protein n=1 Tax=Clathrus columnatus TaxID=1419009 RepID=A0AAV5A706_9AGAM|nr:hypothetical protein Clacol_004291 [Clathrus columnatus]
MFLHCGKLSRIFYALELGVMKSLSDTVFVRQFHALWVKNWIVLSKHKLLNLARCLIAPFAYGIFLGVAQIFLVKPNHYGLGTPAPILSLKDAFDPSLSLIWADGTNLSSSVHPSPSDVMNMIIDGLSPAQRAAVKKVDTPDDIQLACPQNFNLFSECFAAVAFTSFPPPMNVSLSSVPPIPPPLNVTSITGLGAGPVNFSQISLNETVFDAPNGTDILPPQSLLNYTIRADAGLGFIDVVHHKSDFEIRVLPLQWAIDQAIIQLQTGSKPPDPLEWPYSIETDKEQALKTRLSYIRGLRTLLVLALFINFVGISYHIPGSYVTERTIGLTAHLRAMGLRDLPRILSWHFSISVAYLPGWILTALLWHFQIFSGTNVGLMIVIHILTGFSLGSYSFFISLPSLSPSLAASMSTFLAILFAILGLVFSKASTGAATIFILIFPPSFYVFAIRALAGFEVHQIPTSIIKRDPDNKLVLLPLLIITIFLYPYITVLLERRFYDVRDPPRKVSYSNIMDSNSSTGNAIGALENKADETAPAITVNHLVKRFPPSTLPRILRPWTWLGYLFRKIRGIQNNGNDNDVIAIADLSFTVPRGGIFVLLGSNGAGKSTCLGIIAGLIGRSGGSVVFPENENDSHPFVNRNGGKVEEQESERKTRKSSKARGSLGIVPQKNVLFPELTCYQTLRLWSAVKRPSRSDQENGSEVYVERTKEDLERLLVDCGLETKIHANAGNLSGGQKRKLQLAIGLVGGSQIVLVDECTSGVDPLSRRSIWRTLTSVKHERTIVFTTHFLDEADLLADNIAVLAAPGKLVAEGSPVALKSRLGKGYTLRVRFSDTNVTTRSHNILRNIRHIVPNASFSAYSAHGSDILLHSKDSDVVKEVLEIIQRDVMVLGVVHYEVHSTSVEDIFLDLMALESNTRIQDDEPEKESTASASDENGLNRHQVSELKLTSGRKKHPLSQSLTIFYKRCLIFRKNWLPSLLAVLIAVAGSCIPLFFITGREETCKTTFSIVDPTPLYLGDSPFSSVADLFFPGNDALISPPNLAQSLGPSLAEVPFQPIPDNGTFVQEIMSNFMNLSLGGVSIDLKTNQALVAWQAAPPGLTAPTMLNLASNILYNRALNVSGRAANLPSIIAANYQSLPFKDPGTLDALKWVAFFGAAMGAFPAFFTLYVSMERRTSIQAMQFSNGLTNPIGLWLGHLLFDTVFCVILSTIITIVFATASNQFNGVGYMWLIMALYGIAAALFAYCVTLFTPSPLAAFAAVAAYQVIIFILRACLVSLNLFSLLCADGDLVLSSLGEITKFGGPIVYLIGQSLLFFAILVYVDSGSLLPRLLQFTRPKLRELNDPDATTRSEDVVKEIEEVETLPDDPLRVLHVTKTFDGSNKAVDDVSFRVPQDTVFAMLGPNGAGKTSTFNMIRGDVTPDFGDVYINQTSIISHPNRARLQLGVCPQFTAIDPQLTVHEHLVIYGLLKGLRRGPELEENISILLRGTTLTPYADRLANQLSGGNQRKLSFAISLIGNPSVVLIDEYSTGIDPATKRSMWVTFRRMAVGKAVVITTPHIVHMIDSMEEASALANKVGILAGKMLAVGSTEELTARHALYEVHLPARTREEIAKARALMAQIPGSRMADDVATRFEVPIATTSDSSASQSSLTLAQLFGKLNDQNAFNEYTVERISLESIFLKVIRQHNIEEENNGTRTRARRRRRFLIF